MRVFTRLRLWPLKPPDRFLSGQRSRRRPWSTEALQCFFDGDLEDHEFYSRMYASGRRGARPARPLLPREIKRYLHPAVGPLAASCQILLDPEQSHILLVYTAAPGSESYEKLQLLSMVGV